MFIAQFYSLRIRSYRWDFNCDMLVCTTYISIIMKLTFKLQSCNGYNDLTNVGAGTVDF